ncbi:MAG TPA: nuclear transport factor 2 family protein [Saprospiraceae bacterium]|nr:nuclear transport factor 2 family protein [Saprospiraceae bacterium]HMP25916.1 nuclear transport factor 2 family protein [Saprospiraceae bacterium]
MRKLLFLAALLCCTMTLQAQSVNDEVDMHTFARKFMAVYNSNDHAALGKMYTPDALRIDAQGKEIKGADNIVAYFADQFLKNNATLLLKQTELVWADAEQALVAKGTYEIYGKTNVYDIPIDVAGQYANVMLKQNGEWKIAKSMLLPLASSDNVAVVDGLYQAFAKGDVPAVLAVMDANIVWNEAESFPYADRNPYIGPDAVLNGVFARIGEEWAYWNLTDIQLHEMSDNMVLATLRYKAKHKKTGKVIDSQTAHLWTLKDNRITAFQQFTDTKQAAEAVK